jgi:hypothetical protein
MSDSEVEDYLKCDVCKDFFYDPITLLCQHTFCSFCLASLKECPMCRLKIHLPKQKNKLMTELIETIYGTEKLEELNTKFHLTKLEKEIRPQIEKDLKLNFDNMLMDNSKTSPKYSDKDIKNINITQSITEQSQNDLVEGVVDTSTKENSIWDFNLENLIKWIELAFVAYHVWSLISNSTSCGFSWIKFLLNTIMLIQTLLSMFGTIDVQYFSIGGTSNVLTGMLEDIMQN